jgi:hypothetical protein
MATENTLSQQLLDLLATRNLHPEMLDRSGRPTDAPEAKTFTFDYEGASGKNYGTMVIVLDSDNEMKIMYGDNLGRTMEGTDKNEFFDFIQHLSKKATMNRWTHTIADISQLKHTMQGLAAIQEGLFEGYYGNRNISYAGAPTQARLKIKHSQPLGENDARFRHVESLFVETADGECFRLGFRNLSGGRAMLEHVRQGGKPYDIRGCHLTEMVNEIATLARFNRASAGRVLEGVTQEVVSQAQVYYKQLRENLKRMSTSRGYSKYFESWHPADITEQEELVENIKTLFVEQTIDTRIEQALPLLAKIQQGLDMKEAKIFESWIDNLAEGTWNLPETPEQLDKLKTMMASELIVGPDAINATEQLYDLVGDDILFDRLSELAAKDPRANAWNDTEVMNRLAELGIEMPEPSEPGNPAEPATAPVAPVAAAPAAPAVPPAPVAEELDPEHVEYLKRQADISRSTGLAVGDRVTLKDRPGFEGEIVHDWGGGDFSISGSGGGMSQSKNHRANARLIQKIQGVAEESSENKYSNLSSRGVNRGINRAGDDFDRMMDLDQVGSPHYKTQHQQDTKQRLKTKPMAGPKGHLPEQDMAESAELNTMLKYAGIPVAESRVLDEAGETIDHILNRFKHEVKQFEQGNDLDSDLYEALFDYYSDAGEMPYGVAKARTGDPFSWVSDKLADHLGVNEGFKDKLAGLALAGTVALGSMGGGAGAKVDSYAPDLNTGVKGSSAVISNPGDKKTDIKYQAPIKGQSATIGEADPISTFEVMSGFDAPVAESSCNMTAEGAYCPEHGLAECGGGGMYESREGDAMLARIKSLALIR